MVKLALFYLILGVSLAQGVLNPDLSSNSDAVASNEQNSCNIKLKYEAANGGDESANNLFGDGNDSSDHQSSVYVGHNHNYDVSCQISDPKLKSDDKYYVVDLVVYGPNSRVAKAWREQYNAHGRIISSRNQLSLDKKVSFRWVGQNSIFCLVTKYNSVVNKFVKICQKTVNVNATERGADLSRPVNYIDQLFMMQRTNRTRLSASLKQLEELKNLISKQKKLLLSNTSNVEEDNTNNAAEIKQNSESVVSVNSTHQAAENLTDQGVKESLNATAMQFAYSNEMSGLKKNRNILLAKDPNEKLSESKTSSRQVNMLQPLLIIMVFLIIFSISIGTIAYLTYHQKSSSENDYSSVKQNDVEDQMTGSDVNSQSGDGRSETIHSPTHSTLSHHKFKLVSVPAESTTPSTGQNLSMWSTSQISSTISTSECNETHKLNNDEDDDQDDVNDYHKFRRK